MMTAQALQSRALQTNRDDLERSVWYSGYLMTFRATAEETGGAFSIVEGVGRKGLSAEPPPHIHTRETEIFYILEGRMTFWVGDEVIEAGPGALVSLPPNVPHSFSLASDDVRMLNICVPGGFEGYFRDIGVPAEAMTLPPPSDDPIDVPHLIGTAANYSVEFLPPPSE